MSIGLTNKRIVVLGGTGALGEGVVHGLAGTGAKIGLAGRNESKLSVLASRIDGQFVLCDASDQASMEAAAEDLCAKLGGIDGMVAAVGGNQAGATLPPAANFFDLDVDALRQVFDLNLFSGIIIPLLTFGKRIRGGSIVTVSSASAELPLTRVGGYGAAKAALANFTKWAAVELGKRTDGAVRVNSVQPGFFIGEQNRSLLIDQSSGQPTARGGLILDHTPAGRFGEPADLVGAVNFLLSDESKFVSGAVIPVDGGFSAWWGI